MGAVALTVCYRVSDFVGGHLTCIMIADEKSKEQEGFLPAPNHHICPFKRLFGTPITDFLLSSPSKLCSFADFAVLISSSQR